MMLINKLSKAIVASMTMVFALFLAGKTSSQTQRITSSTEENKGGSHSIMRWEHSDDGERFRLEIDGKAEFNDDYTDIRGISDGGYVRIEEDHKGTSRRFEVRPSGNGQLQRSYYVNGEKHALDDAGRAWVAKIILEAVRQSGWDADRRVQSLLRKGGVRTVLDEIASISSDYAQRIYFISLIQNAKLDSAELQSVLHLAAKDISSDYEQAQLLIAVAPQLTTKDPATTAAYFEATSTIKSDYDRRRVLTNLLKQGTPSREVLTHVARSAAEVSSDFEKATILKEVAAMYLDDATLRTTFFQTVNAITSDYEHRGVLSALLHTARANEAVLTALLDSATRMTSDYEKATFLLEASTAYTGEARFKSAFLKAVDSIKSEYERGRVLSALVKNKQIG